MPPTSEEIVRNIVVIIARKADYLHALFGGLLSQGTALLPKERKNLNAGLVRAVAALEPRLFVTPEEARDRRLNLQNNLDKLDRETLAGALERALQRI